MKPLPPAEPASELPADPPVPLAQALRALWPSLRAFPVHVSFAAAMLVAAKLAAVGLPLLLKQLVDTLDAQRGAALALPLALLFGYGALRFVNVLFGELRDVVFGRVSERAMRRAGLQVFEHLHRLDLEFHLSRRSGALARDIERGVEGIGFLLRFALFTILPTILELALVMAVLWRVYELSFALVALVAVVAYVAWSVLITDWRTRYVREANERDSQANARALDSLLNFETVKYFGAERLESKRYDRALESYERAAGKSRGTLAMLNAGQAFIIAAGLTAMTTLAAQRVGAGQMTLGDFVAVNAFMTQLFLPLNVLGFVYREIRRALTDMGKLFRLQALVPRVVEPARPTALPPGPLTVAFDHVGFSYRPDRNILRSVDFEIPAGHTVAVVGASGAGKSTLARLLFRFYDPQQGAVRLGGVDLRELPLEQLRGALGVVPQDVVLFNDSLLENLRYGCPDASLAEVGQALRQSQLAEFVARLPQGLDTPVGERGLKLSGGEKQRVAIARVLLKNPPVLIFDEATSSLDTVAERGILAALREAAAHRTVLVIAHRLSTVVHADRIVVLDQGRVVEQGSHPQLLAQGGAYARLWEAQRHEREELLAEV
ncbi:MAG: ABC transporter ATP-binding protein/permease [Stagnimonas sp.]|nr:ABC transporter ATP-binding protein/permease [Stagnimonas sp.]